MLTINVVKGVLQGTEETLKMDIETVTSKITTGTNRI